LNASSAETGGGALDRSRREQGYSYYAVTR